MPACSTTSGRSISCNGQATICSRGRIWPTQDLTAASLVVPVIEALTLVLIPIADWPGGELPASAQRLALFQTGVRLTRFSLRAVVRMAHETSGLKSAGQKARGRSIFGAAAVLGFDAVFHAVA